MGFVGVSTGQSAIRTVFPEWADALGLPTRTLRGYDLPLDSRPEAYRKVVEEIQGDPRHWGALVTTHKVALYAATSDLFDTLDELALTFGEVSCIAKRGERLIGSAKDPMTVRLALEEFLPSDHFASSGAEALVLGCGGAGTALSQQLAARSDRPTRITCTELAQQPLDHARTVHGRAGVPEGLIRYQLTRTVEEADRLLESLPAASLVVNSTGMGKDRPGSPVSDAAVFPYDSLIWEFNYRGPLDFLQQARRQQRDRSLQLEDGWRYFIHGWTQAIAEIFGVPMPLAKVDELSRVAAGLR
jgi:shikimate dehydrogenase